MRLKEVRKKSNKTQTQVAQFLKITQEKYSRIESGITTIDMQTWIQLADYFHTTVDFLMDHDVPYLINKSALTKNQLEIFEIIQNLNDDNCKLVKAYLVGLLTAEEEKQNIIKKFTKGE